MACSNGGIEWVDEDELDSIFEDMEEMKMKYECVKSFVVDEYDEGCFCTGKSTKIEKGEIFQYNDSKSNLIGGEVHLSNDGTWIEISFETLREHFYEVYETGGNRKCIKKQN